MAHMLNPNFGKSKTETEAVISLGLADQSAKPNPSIPASIESHCLQNKNKKGEEAVDKDTWHSSQSPMWLYLEAVFKEVSMASLGHKEGTKSNMTGVHMRKGKCTRGIWRPCEHTAWRQHLESGLQSPELLDTNVYCLWAFRCVSSSKLTISKLMWLSSNTDGSTQTDIVLEG